MSRTRSMPLQARDEHADLDGHSLTAITRHRSDDDTHRTNRPRGSFDALDWRQAVGGALIGLGVIGIIVAWFGVSGTLDPGEQMPYISSGGFGGSALIAIGVTLLVSFEHMRDRDALYRVLAELEELERRIDSFPNGSNDANGRNA